MSTVQVFIRSVYGVDKVYPKCETAQRFADLLGVKTFSPRQLAGIEGLGFHVEHVSDPRAEAAYRRAITGEDQRATARLVAGLRRSM